MDRNTEYNLNGLPDINRPRSTHRYKKRHMSTFNVGDLVPFYTNILISPGDTFKLNLSMLLRLQTPIYPTMDNLWADVYFFGVPWIDLWEHTREFFGENNTGVWTQTTEYTVPAVFKHSNTAITKNSLLNHMGIPLESNTSSTRRYYGAKLAVNAYNLIWNYWFRDENLTEPVEIDLSDSTIVYSESGSTQQEKAAAGGGMLKVSKFHDYFTSALPAPQKGSAQTLPLGSTAPVIGNGKAISFTSTNGTTTIDGVNFTPNMYEYGTVGHVYSTPIGLGDSNTSSLGNDYKTIGLSTNANYSGMITDLTNAIATTINALRDITAIQHILETDARYGTRYGEILRGRYGISVSPRDLHIPEYLGGKRFPINIEAVLQTSSTDSTSPQGSAAGYSITADSSEMFTKSFNMHYVILGLICVRQDHTYSQGIPCQFTKSTKYDFFCPELANIGEQPILNKEIYVKASEGDAYFGYKQAWQEYRQEINEITGELSPIYEESLDAWHYGDEYSSEPVLGEDWISETKDFVDRTITVQSSVADQFLMDSIVDIVKVSEVPLFSIPGLNRF